MQPECSISSSTLELLVLVGESFAFQSICSDVGCFKLTVVSSFRGKSPSQAEISFLNKCKWLELYGVDMHFVKVSAFLFGFFSSKLSACYRRFMRAKRRFFFRAEMEENTPWVSLPPASWCLKAPTKSASSFGKNGCLLYYI